MKLIKCLGTAAVVLAICLILSGGGYEECDIGEVPMQLHTVEVEEIPPYEYVFYDVPLTEDQQREIQIYAHLNCVPYEIVLGVMKAESGFRADVIGDSGDSLGIMQVQPKWHTWRLEETGGTDWFDAVDNAKVGIHILSEKLQKYGNVEKALVVYNMGDGGAKGIESTAYSQRVLSYAEVLLDDRCAM